MKSLPLIVAMQMQIGIAAGNAAAADAPPPAQDASHWQAMAQADLDAVHAIVLSSHPGAIDEQNPDFRIWMEQGYREAKGLLPRARNYDDMLSVVRFYVIGFEDGHLHYSDHARNDKSVTTLGWSLSLAGTEYRVAAAASEWPGALPPPGAKLLECDGRSADSILDTDIAPFVDRRKLPGLRAKLAEAFVIQPLSGAELEQCRFATAAGEKLSIPVLYREMPLEEAIPFAHPADRASHRENSFTFENGVLWISAPDFALSKDEADSLEAMLKRVRALKNVRAIVFDARGNGGGDSSVGDRIFESATGGLDFGRRNLERLPKTTAQWRVSDLSIATVSQTHQSAVELYGAQGEESKWSRALLDELKAARAAGRSWVEQPGGGGYRIDRAEMARRHGRLAKFRGKVLLVTDSACASACLDFADEIRLVPGSVHVGEPTSADAVYIDTGWSPMPSGNPLVMPLKVWRNRLRGNNEVLQPDVPLGVPIDDDAKVRAATLEVLEKTH